MSEKPQNTIASRMYENKMRAVIISNSLLISIPVVLDVVVRFLIIINFLKKSEKWNIQPFAIQSLIDCASPTLGFTLFTIFAISL